MPGGQVQSWEAWSGAEGTGGEDADHDPYRRRSVAMVSKAGSRGWRRQLPDAHGSDTTYATSNLARRRLRDCCFTTISTSLPSSTRNLTRRSSEKPVSLPRLRAETFGWSTS